MEQGRSHAVRKVDIELLFEIDTAIDICAVIYSKGRYIINLVAKCCMAAEGWHCFGLRPAWPRGNGIYSRLIWLFVSAFIAERSRALLTVSS